MDFRKQFLDTVLGSASKAYGTVDRTVFGGNLPGGAARIRSIPQGEAESPIKTAAKSLLNQVIKDKLNEVVTQATIAQPVVQALTQAVPEPVRQAARNVSNALPLPVNLFTRYYTGLGGKDVQVDTASLRQLQEAIAGAESQRGMDTADLISKIKSAEAELHSPYAVQSPILRKSINDMVAEFRSDLNKYNQGFIQMIPRETDAALGGANPLTSVQTSVGRAWVQPTPGGYKTNEKYDFQYAGADYKQPDKQSEQYLTNAASAITANLLDPSLPQPASENAMTNIMRALVSKMQNSPSFNYSITVPR